MFPFFIEIRTICAKSLLSEPNLKARPENNRIMVSTGCTGADNVLDVGREKRTRSDMRAILSFQNTRMVLDVRQMGGT